MASPADFIQALLGGQAKASAPPAPVKPDFEPAPPLKSFPSSNDAEYARKYGFGYGSGHEPYLNGDVGRLFGQQAPLGFIPRSAVGLTINDTIKPDASANMEITRPELKANLSDAMMRGALGVNRVPIAALGFDPSRTAVDASGRETSLGGAYNRGTDMTYVNPAGGAPSSVVHESIHRGIEQLRNDPEAKKILRGLPDEEYIVRWLMQKHAGDPEVDTNPVLRNAAFGKFTAKPEDAAAVDRLTEIAQRLYAERRPRGPK